MLEPGDARIDLGYPPFLPYLIYTAVLECKDYRSP